MKKITKIFLSILLIILCSTPYLKTIYGYPTNYGIWKQDYVNDLCTKYNIYSTEEIENINTNENITLESALNLLARIRYLKDNPTKNISNMPKNIIEYSYKIGLIESKEIEKTLLESSINRYEFVSLVIKSIKEEEMLVINNISDNSIPDIDDSHTYYNDIYTAYRYGLICGTNNIGTFSGEANITNYQAFVVANRILNPNLRQAISLYQKDNIEIQSNSYPMYYKNTTKNLEINITKERYYNTDCFVAHITMKNPCHIKTIYSDFEWSNIGCEASTFNKRIDSIFMVNGDFRNSEYGEKLGIVRNKTIVNNKPFQNILGLDINGNLMKVNANNAQSVLNSNIRDTWTFGPWLIIDGKITNLDNKTKHPRTFIGQVKRNDGIIEYIIVVADGRSENNAGLTNKEMANILLEKKCYIGYNLDGGGSSIMMFMGKVLNKPAHGERADIDYIYIK